MCYGAVSAEIQQTASDAPREFLFVLSERPMTRFSFTRNVKTPCSRCRSNTEIMVVGGTTERRLRDHSIHEGNGGFESMASPFFDGDRSKGCSAMAAAISSNKRHSGDSGLTGPVVWSGRAPDFSSDIRISSCLSAQRKGSGVLPEPGGGAIRLCVCRRLTSQRLLDVAFLRFEAILGVLVSPQLPIIVRWLQQQHIR